MTDQRTAPPPQGGCPRVVHVVWVGSAVPARVERLRDDILRHDPTVMVRVWTDADLEWLRHRALMVREPLRPAQADIARYEILLRHGGIYLDADFRVHRPLAGVFEAVDRHGLIVARQSRTVFNNAFIGARPGHPLLRDLVDRIPDAYRWTGSLTAPATTGPLYLTERLMAHLRAGGAVHELPQHAIYPWYADERPLPAGALPASVLMSHEWAGMGRWSWNEVPPEPTTVHVPDRASRRHRAGRGLRVRASTLPSVHRIVAGAETMLLGSAGEPPRRDGPADTVRPTDAVIESWMARQAVRRLAGSATFIDVHPASPLPLLAATRVLDRPGHAILVARPGQVVAEDDWRDPSIRCSVHLVRTQADDGARIAGLESQGATLVPRTLSSQRPPLGRVDSPGPLRGLDQLVASLPRCDLIRIDAAHLTQAVASTVASMLEVRRARRLVVTLDPLSVAGGIEEAARMLSRLERSGLPVRLRPWLVDGRGRTWSQHLRVATRPFLVVIG